jgi:hypothetical protein
MMILVRNFEPCFDIIVPSEPGEGVPLVGNGGENTINNHFLFRLGVFLLEMALGQPLAQLPKPPGLVDGMSRDQIDYFTAVHNQPMTGKAMGPVYSTIVKQCLKCNFSCQLTDLSENLLQVEIYKDVICKLGTLKNISRSMWA